MKVIAQGAEAILYLQKFEGKTVLIKERLKKGYRIAQLDTKIRQNRTKIEADLLARAKRTGIAVPMVIDVKDFKIVMEWLGEKRLKERLSEMEKNERLDVWAQIGSAVAKLHNYGILHGDLTTSNMIVKNGKIYFIDFGLGRISKRIEDQAVDLYLLYEAIKAAHFDLLKEGWSVILKSYKKNYSQFKAVIDRFDNIKKRRRYM
jgi:Kae1-associated kinase Bud32